MTIVNVKNNIVLNILRQDGKLIDDLMRAVAERGYSCSGWEEYREMSEWHDNMTQISVYVTLNCPCGRKERLMIRSRYPEELMLTEQINDYILTNFLRQICSTFDEHLEEFRA